jgi:thioredoxin 1
MNKIKAIMLLFGSPDSFSSIMMQKFIRGLREEYKGRLKAIFYNVWSPHGLYYAGKFEIRVIPTIVILDKEGTEYFRHEGFLYKEKLVNVLKIKVEDQGRLPESSTIEKNNKMKQS